METFTEQGFTYSECLQKIRSKYGEKITVLNQKSVRIGGFLGLFTRDGVELTGIIKEYPRYTHGSAVPKPLDFQEAKEQVLAAANRPSPPKPDPLQQAILKEVLEIKKRIAESPSEEHPTLKQLGELLELNDFSPSYSRNILDRVKKECSLEELENYDKVQDRVVEWIGESIRIYSGDTSKKHPRIMILVGPTGVGKTTTIVKLAAIFGPGNKGRRPLSIRLITVDYYRIAATQQLERYGDIMEVPVTCVDNVEDLRKTVALYREGVDLILVDTIGRSPRAAVELAEMKQLLDGCGSGAEIHLVAAAPTKYRDIREIFQQFEPFNYRSVIISKMDETIRVGNVISALAEKEKPLSYITDGQGVPNDIHRADAVRFLLNLEGFKIDRDRIDERFSPDESEKI
ncbi:MAG: flagellar biosynthesis protein FlhF [Spirochaetaceae bacterium]|jgi:flagellar biosynthesis protein FlhF|nr:flagellar biosynthesis protein FlhF [Spirochaetaceae bacterium]